MGLAKVCRIPLVIGNSIFRQIAGRLFSCFSFLVVIRSFAKAIGIPMLRSGLMLDTQMILL